MHISIYDAASTSPMGLDEHHSMNVAYLFQLIQGSLWISIVRLLHLFFFKDTFGGLSADGKVIATHHSLLQKTGFNSNTTLYK